MSMARRAATAVLIGALLLAGCAAQVVPEAKVVVDGVPSGECFIHPTPGPGPFLQCPTAVSLAVEKLTLLPGTVSAVEFHLGVLCPPNARCRHSTDEGTVIFWFLGVPPIMVPITHDGAASFVAGEPQAVPQWLVDEREASARR
jgi:hypothetical protein